MLVVEEEEEEEEDFVEMNCAADYDLQNDEETPEFEERGFVIYGNLGVPLADFNQAKPMSLVCTRGEDGGPDFYCCVRQFGNKIAMQLKVDWDVAPIYRFGMYYFNFEMVDVEEIVDWNEVYAAKYCMLLPIDEMVATQGKHEYAVISSDWSCLGKDGYFVQSYKHILRVELESWLAD